MLVQEHGELFRQGVSVRRLEEWKRGMWNGKHLPSWIREIENENERHEAIGSITTDDVFRSQFRAGENADRSPIEILDWGVQHIERLRKAELDKTQRSAKSWELWVVFGVGILNVIATVLIAIVK